MNILKTQTSFYCDSEGACKLRDLPSFIPNENITAPTLDQHQIGLMQGRRVLRMPDWFWDTPKVERKFDLSRG